MSIYAPDMINYLRKSLSCKILVILSLSVALVMLSVIYLTVQYETKEMLNQMTAHSEEMTEAIYAGIKYPMSVGDSGAVEKHLLQIKDKMKNIEIFICDHNRKISFSCHEDSIDLDMEKYIYDKKVVKALDHALASGSQPEEAFEEYFSGRTFLVNIHPILNQKECFDCHGSEQKVLGAFVIRQSTDRNYSAIIDLRNTNILISIVGICAIIVIAHTFMVNMVTKPIKKLSNDIKVLPDKIARGSGLAVPYIGRTDEIGDLQNSFNLMAIDLDASKRDIEHSSMELMKANKELEAFAYSVSHDLRAPLRNIDGFSKILLDEFSEKLDDKAKHYLTRVRIGTARMSLLIDDMLTFSRIGRAELHLKPVNCSRIIHNILEYFSKEIKEKGISVHLGELPLIQCDATLMQSLFSNLISNAIKFSDNTEKPEIEIGYDEEKEAIFVRDNGMGFDKQFHDKIFEVFQRLNLQEEYEGTGIGLAIVKRVAERHRGEVWAESQVGKGATFYVKLPIPKEG